MASIEQLAAAKAEGALSTAEGVGHKEQGSNENGGASKEHDYVMVGEDSSREQVCARLQLSNAKSPTLVLMIGMRCSLLTSHFPDVSSRGRVLPCSVLCFLRPL